VVEPSASVSRTMTFYRLATVGLLACVAALGFAVLSQPEPAALQHKPASDGLAGDPASPAMAGTPTPAPAGAVPPAAPSPEVAGETPSALASIDVHGKLRQLSMLFPDATRYSEYLHDQPPGTVRVEFLGYAQRGSFGFDRRLSVVTAVLGATATLEHTCDNTGTLQRLVLAAGSVVEVPSYCGHRWLNEGSESMLGLVHFESPFPLDSQVSTRVECDPTDRRGTLGGRIRAWDAGGPADSTLLGSRVRLSDMAEPQTLSPGPAARGMLVLSGSVQIGFEAGTSQTLTVSQLAVLPANQSYSVTATAPETRVALFDPAQDGVSELARTVEVQFSQGREEALIRGHFADARGLVFLDVGSAEPQRISTTYYLESALGWSGIAIDAQREYGPAYAELRPATRFFSYFVSDSDALSTTLYRDSRVPVVASNDEGVAREQVVAAVGEANIEAVEVETITLNTLLQREGLDHVDFVSLDIEEHEPAALRAFDLGRYAPALLCIEAHGRTQDAIYEWMVTHGYRRIDSYLAYDSVNWYFEPAAL